MKLVTRFQAAALNTTNLRGLLRETFNKMARSAPDSAQRRNTLASLENIQGELVRRPFT